MPVAPAKILRGCHFEAQFIVNKFHKLVFYVYLEVGRLLPLRQKLNKFVQQRLIQAKTSVKVRISKCFVVSAFQGSNQKLNQTKIVFSDFT